MGPGAQTFDYPPDIQSEKSRQQNKRNKKKTQKSYLKTHHKKGKIITTNLFFYTDRLNVWHTAFCTHYTHNISQNMEFVKAAAVYIWRLSKGPREQATYIKLLPEWNCNCTGKWCCPHTFWKGLPLLKRNSGKGGRKLLQANPHSWDIWAYWVYHPCQYRGKNWFRRKREQLSPSCQGLHSTCSTTTQQSFAV